MRSPQRHALSVLQSVLSGQGGRLFLELRDKKSLCYSVSALNGEGLEPGYFGVYIGTSPEKVGEAKSGIRTELERLIHDRIAPDELLRAQRHLVGAHEIGLQRYGARAAVMALDECYGIGAANHLSIAERIFAVTADDVRDAARTFIDFDRCVTALVAPDA
jgi:zinc protease